MVLSGRAILSLSLSVAFCAKKSAVGLPLNISWLKVVNRVVVVVGASRQGGVAFVSEVI